MAESFQIPVAHPHIDAVGALWHPPAGRDTSLLLAHGAGADMEHPWLESIAQALHGHGFGVLRFRYPYMEKRARDGRRRPPDAMKHLEATHERAAEELARRTPRARWIFAGKSMGGRVGSHLAARGGTCAGLAFLGYPLHPPGRPANKRSEHFAAIAQPALFLQGTRDKLCDLGLLEQALASYGGTPTVSIVEGADHGFKVPKASGRTSTEVIDELAARIDAWERETFPD